MLGSQLRSQLTSQEAHLESKWYRKQNLPTTLSLITGVNITGVNTTGTKVILLFSSVNLWFFSATGLLVVQLVWQAFLSDAALSYVMHTSVDSASTSHSSPQSTCTYMYMMSCIANHSLLKQAMAAVWVEKMLIAPSL